MSNSNDRRNSTPGGIIPIQPDGNNVQSYYFYKPCYFENPVYFKYEPTQSIPIDPTWNTIYVDNIQTINTNDNMTITATGSGNINFVTNTGNVSFTSNNAVNVELKTGGLSIDSGNFTANGYVYAENATFTNATNQLIMGNTTLTAPSSSSVTLTLPSSTDTLVGRNTTDTLTNKTLNGATAINNFTVSSGQLITNGNAVIGGGIQISGGGTYGSIQSYPDSTGGIIEVATGSSGGEVVFQIPYTSGSGDIITTVPTSQTDTLCGLATPQTLTNKTLTAPVISTIVNTGTLTLPSSTDTLVARSTTDTLTNKTISSCAFSGTQTGTLTLGTGLVLPTTGGTQGTLSYYETQQSSTISFTGPFSGTMDITLSMIGNQKFVQWTDFTGTSSDAATMSGDFASGLSRYYPASTINFVCYGESGGENTILELSISTSGEWTIGVYPDKGNFAGSGAVAVWSSCVSYS